jgi:hypothetical protein
MIHGAPAAATNLFIVSGMLFLLAIAGLGGLIVITW